MQDFALVEEYSAIENVMIPMYLTEPGMMLNVNKELSEHLNSWV